MHLQCQGTTVNKDNNVERIEHSLYTRFTCFIGKMTGICGTARAPFPTRFVPSGVAIGIPSHIYGQFH